MAYESILNEPATADAELLKRLRESDPEAWHTVADAFRQRLRDLAAAQLPFEITARADASDVVQQTLAEASEHIAAFHGTSLRELYGWLATTLNHNVGDAVRDHLLARRRRSAASFRSNPRSDVARDPRPAQR